jgi:hypothetical protein
LLFVVVSVDEPNDSLITDSSVSRGCRYQIFEFLDGEFSNGRKLRVGVKPSRGVSFEWLVGRIYGVCSLCLCLSFALALPFARTNWIFFGVDVCVRSAIGGFARV